jgi:quercetin dioxygenase-like cupin family protein
MNIKTNKKNSKPAEVLTMISYQEGAVVSRELIKTENSTITLFAFDEGQGLSEHTTPYTALVQLIEGKAEISIDKKDYLVKAGEIIFMPANQPHALKAVKRFKMLLTMIK